MRKFLAILLVLLGLVTYAHASTLYDPQIKWQSISTPYVRILYPEGFEYQAYKVLAITNSELLYHSHTVGQNIVPVTIILGRDEVQSNGYVSLMPYHSAFYTVGMQNQQILGSNDWVDALALHEFRHVMQFSNSLHGLTKWGRYIFLDLGWGGFQSVIVPNWYMEGDAVLTETLLSDGGRGRTPYFRAQLRAQLLDDQRFSYMTARCGSYNLPVVNHYPMGYTLTNFVRNTYGENVLGAVQQRATKGWPLLYPYASALKHYTGHNAKQLYRMAYDSLAQATKQQVASLSLTPGQPITTDDASKQTEYYAPKFAQDGTLYALKTSNTSNVHLVSISPKGKQKQLLKFGVALNNNFSLADSLLVCMGYDPDLWVTRKSKNRLYFYDLRTQKKRSIALENQCFSPALSHKAQRVVMVESDAYLNTNLVIVDLQGKVIRRIYNGANDFLSKPQWSMDDGAIVYVAKRNHRLALMFYDLKSDTFKRLTPWSHHVINQPAVSEDGIYFSASYSGIDNIYRVSPEVPGQVEQMTSVPVGAYEVAVSADNQQLVVREITASGSRLTAYPNIVHARVLFPFDVDSKGLRAQGEASSLLAGQPPLVVQEPRDMSLFGVHCSPFDYSIIDSVQVVDVTPKALTVMQPSKPYHSFVSRKYNFVNTTFSNSPYALQTIPRFDTTRTSLDLLYRKSKDAAPEMEEHPSSPQYIPLDRTRPSVLSTSRVYGWFLNSTSDRFDLGVHAKEIRGLWSLSAGYYTMYDYDLQGFKGSLSYDKYPINLQFNGFLNRSEVALNLNRTRTYIEQIYQMKFVLPMRWIRGAFIHSAEVYASLDDLNLTLNDTQAQGTPLQGAFVQGYEVQSHENLLRTGVGASYSVGLRTPVKRIYTPFAWGISLDYINDLKAKYPSRFDVQTSLYLPGVWPTHSLNFKALYSAQDFDKSEVSSAKMTLPYTYTSTLWSARGINPLWYSSKLVVRSQYDFPLLYPNFGVGNAIYFKRIRANVFYDVMGYSLTEVSESVGYKEDKALVPNHFLASYGASLLFDNTYFNVVGLTLGLEYYKIKDREDTGVNILLQLNL